MNYLRVFYSTIHNTTILFQKTQQIFSLIKVLEEYNKASHWLIQIIITISWYRDLCSNWPWSPRQVDNYWGHWIRCVECSRLYYTIVVFTKFQNNKICSALVSYFEGHGIAGSNNIFWGSSIFKGANWYQKVVGQNGRGKEFRGLSDNCFQELTF